MKIYGYWNNKGGTGKTSLCFQSICFYAKEHPDERILAIDVCPQANLSELFLGGLTSGGSAYLLERQQEMVRATIAGYFQMRLPSPYTPPTFDAEAFLTTPADYNDQIPDNVRLVCGDPLVELQSNAISTLANQQIPLPGTPGPWVAIIDWIKDFLEPLEGEFDTVFIDTNPSFSIYTQIALSACQRLVLPVMADDSSRRAIQNAFSLVYGLRLPSEIYTQYAFATKLKAAERSLPYVHLIARNRITQYMGSASAYEAVLASITNDVRALLGANPEMFSFNAAEDGVVDIRDFQTTGVVAFARGTPFYALTSGRKEIMGHRVQVKEEYRQNCVEVMDALVAKL